MMKIYKDFLDFLRLLKTHNVKYLLVGGYAVSYYGYPRLTMDMDIWIKTSSKNAKNIVKAIREFGFGTADLSAELFKERGNIVRMGVKPQLIEVLTSISGVEFDECYSRCTVANIEKVEINFISLDDLKKNKLAANRPKDISDLNYLP